MENGSRALIMAAEILIAIMVLGLFAATVLIFGRFSKSVHKQMTDTQIGAFNQNFFKLDNRIDITAQEIATVINFAKTQNDKNGLSFNDKEESIFYINVFIDGKSYFSKDMGMNETIYNDKKLFQNKLNEFLNENNLNYYSCDSEYYSRTRTLDKDNKYLISVSRKNGDIVLNDKTKLISSINFSKVDIVGQTALIPTTYDVINKDSFSIEYVN